MKERRRKNGYELKRSRQEHAPQRRTPAYDRRDRRRARRRRKAPAQSAKRARNKEFARVTYVFVTLFLGHDGIYIRYFNVVKSKDFISSPYNRRSDTLAKRVTRGKILDKRGKVLAQTTTSADGSETREYPYGREFAHVVGYTAKGKYGLESRMNSELLSSNAFFLEKLTNEFQDKKNPGDNVSHNTGCEITESSV